MSRNDDYTTGNLLDDFYPHKYCKLIGKDLPRKTNISLCGQINFVKIFEEDDSATMCFIAKKQQKNYSKPLFRFINCNRII